MINNNINTAEFGKVKAGKGMEIGFNS